MLAHLQACVVAVGLCTAVFLIGRTTVALIEGVVNLIVDLVEKAAAPKE